MTERDLDRVAGDGTFRNDDIERVRERALRPGSKNLDASLFSSCRGPGWTWELLSAGEVDPARLPRVTSSPFSVLPTWTSVVELECFFVGRAA